MTVEQREVVVAVVFAFAFLAAATLTSVLTGNWDWLLCIGIALAASVPFIWTLDWAAKWVERGR